MQNSRHPTSILIYLPHNMTIYYTQYIAGTIIHLYLIQNKLLSISFYIIVTDFYWNANHRIHTALLQTILLPAVSFHWSACFCINNVSYTLFPSSSTIFIDTTHHEGNTGELPVVTGLELSRCLTLTLTTLLLCGLVCM